MKHKFFPIAIIGTGPIGLITALACGEWARINNKKIILIGPKNEYIDKRTTAILTPAIEFLNSLKIWQKQNDGKIKTIKIIDGTNRLLRATQTEFHAHEMNLAYFAQNIKNVNLLKMLQEKIAKHKHIIFYNTTLKKIVKQKNNSLLYLTNKEIIETSLIAACDGRNSIVRKQCNINVKQWQYNQTALVGNFFHTLPHNNSSIEIHTKTGPLTQVPLGDEKNKHCSSLVWVLDKKQAQEKIKLEKNKQAKIIGEKMQFCLGEIEIEKLQAFELSSSKVEKLAQANCVLLGEAAHLFPPIAAQGFNLGIRDIKALYNLLLENELLNIPSLYEKMRRSDINSQTFSIDLLNRSLLYDFLPLQVARYLGLNLLQQSSWLRNKLMKKLLTF